MVIREGVVAVTPGAKVTEVEHAYSLLRFHSSVHANIVARTLIPRCDNNVLL